VDPDLQPCLSLTCSFLCIIYNTLCYHANNTKIPERIGRGEPTGSKHGTPSYAVNSSQTFLVKCPESHKRQSPINEYYCTSAILVFLELFVDSNFTEALSNLSYLRMKKICNLLLNLMHVILQQIISYPGVRIAESMRNRSTCYTSTRHFFKHV
jgi:hypothetical protein